MILVVAEQKDGVLNRASWEAIAAGQAMGSPVKVAVAGASASKPAAELAAADVAEVIALEHAALEPYTPDGFVQALAALIAAESPSHVVFPHTYQTRDFAPRLGARIDRSLVTDCVAVKSQGSGHVFTRPMFQGKVAADVVIEGPAPHLVTFQIGAFRADAVKTAGVFVRALPELPARVQIRQDQLDRRHLELRMHVDGNAAAVVTD